MVLNTVLIKCNKCDFTPFNSECNCGNLAVTYSDNYRVVEVFVDDISTVSYIQGLINPETKEVKRLMFNKILQENFVENYYLTDKDSYYIPYVNRIKKKGKASGVSSGNLFKHQYEYSQ